MTTKTATKAKTKTTTKTSATTIQDLESKLADEELLARAMTAKYEDLKSLSLAYVGEIDNLVIKQVQGKITAGHVFVLLGDLTKQFDKLVKQGDPD